MSDEKSASDAPAVSRNTVYRVYDLNQRGDLPRKHDVITRLYKDGSPPETVTYPLFSSNDKGCPMPMEHALKFLCDQAFKVISPAGNRIMPIEKLDISKPLKNLAVDEVVVKYQYLARDYLFKLVKMQAGSDEVKANATTEELAAYMVKWRESLAGMTEGERQVAQLMATGDLAGSMTTEQLETMFPSTSRKVA